MRAGLPDRRADAGDAGRRGAMCAPQFPDREVHSVCPYCGVGCQLTYHIKDDKLLYVTGSNGPANENRLCVKGRFGFDYVHHPHRLHAAAHPQGRRAQARATTRVDPANPWTHFREATWEEALDRAAAGLKNNPRPRRLAGARRLRLGQGHRTRRRICSRSWCAPASAPTMSITARGCATPRRSRRCWRAIGSAAVTATFNECKNSEVIIVIGANPTENHPVAATFFKQAAKRGAQLIVMDPARPGAQAPRHPHAAVQARHRRCDAQRHAQRRSSPRSSTTSNTSQTLDRGLQSLRRAHQGFHAGGDGADLRHSRPRRLRTVARNYARAKSAIIFWGMGISQHVHGTDNARCLIALALITGQIGRPGTGLHPLARAEQRAGRLRRRPHPDVLPGLSRRSRIPTIRASVEKAWGTQARSQARPHRGRDHERGARRRDQGHVHHGREPRDVGPRSQSRARGARASRASGRAGHLPHRDRRPMPT